MSKTTSQCNNPKVRQLLEDAISNSLLAPEREADRAYFFEHIDQCQVCRQAMLDHANETALEEVTLERSVEMDDVVKELALAAQSLQETAALKGITFREAMEEVLGRNKQMSLTVSESRA